MAHHSIQQEVDDISSKLKFVAKIQVNQRVNVRNCLSLHDKYSWSSRMWRTYHRNEGRLITFEFVKELISRAYQLLISLRHSNSEYDMHVYRKLITELIQIEPGLRNLTETYKRDDDYVTMIETLIDSLQVKVKELCDYKGLLRESLVPTPKEETEEKKTITPCDQSSSESCDDGNDGENGNDGEDHLVVTKDKTICILEKAVQILEDDDESISESEEPKGIRTGSDPDLPDSPPIQTPKPVNEQSLSQSGRKMTPIHEENDTDLLNKVTFTTQKRRTRRKKLLTGLEDPIVQKSDDNPFRVLSSPKQETTSAVTQNRILKHDYTYDLEAGLFPPRGILDSARGLRMNSSFKKKTV